MSPPSTASLASCEAGRRNSPRASSSTPSVPARSTPRCWGYGPKVAIPRIVESYRQLGLSQTLFIPAWCIEQYPEAIETILKGGHEIARHGFLHEHPRELSDDEEAHWLDRGIGVIAQATGQRPRGWRAPLYNFSHRSADLLAERGFAYDASLMGDDQPYLLESARGRLVELPSHWGLDDWPQYVQSMDLDYMMPVRAPEQGLMPFAQEFEAAHAHGGLWVPVVHPFATGRLARWHHWHRFFESLVARGDVWFAPMEEIAAHVQHLVATGGWTPRIDRMPCYNAPVRVR